MARALPRPSLRCICPCTSLAPVSPPRPPPPPTPTSPHLETPADWLDCSMIHAPSTFLKVNKWPRKERDTFLGKKTSVLRQSLRARIHSSRREGKSRHECLRVCVCVVSYGLLRLARRRRPGWTRWTTSSEWFRPPVGGASFVFKPAVPLNDLGAQPVEADRGRQRAPVGELPSHSWGAASQF